MSTGERQRCLLFGRKVVYTRRGLRGELNGVFVDLGSEVRTPPRCEGPDDAGGPTVEGDVVGNCRDVQDTPTGCLSTPDSSLTSVSRGRRCSLCGTSRVDCRSLRGALLWSGYAFSGRGTLAVRRLWYTPQVRCRGGLEVGVPTG